MSLFDIHISSIYFQTNSLDSHTINITLYPTHLSCIYYNHPKSCICGKSISRALQLMIMSMVCQTNWKKGLLTLAVVRMSWNEAPAEKMNTTIKHHLTRNRLHSGKQSKLIIQLLLVRQNIKKLIKWFKGHSIHAVKQFFMNYWFNVPAPIHPHDNNPVCSKWQCNWCYTKISSKTKVTYSWSITNGGCFANR
jgi:hypothetical protein